MTLLLPDEKHTVDPARSALMARVRQRHTAPELEVRAILRALGISYRLQRRDLPGTPDICIPRLKRVIFVHGCFWHRHKGCKRTTTPKARQEFWLEKFERNVARDLGNVTALKKLGWKVTIVWECECKSRARLLGRLRKTLSSQ